jgi:hypothetical protein
VPSFPHFARPAEDNRVNSRCQLRPFLLTGLP